MRTDIMRLVEKCSSCSTPLKIQDLGRVLPCMYIHNTTMVLGYKLHKLQINVHFRGVLHIDALDDSYDVINILPYDTIPLLYPKTKKITMSLCSECAHKITYPIFIDTKQCPDCQNTHGRVAIHKHHKLETCNTDNGMVHSFIVKNTIYRFYESKKWYHFYKFKGECMSWTLPQFPIHEPVLINGTRILSLCAKCSYTQDPFWSDVRTTIDEHETEYYERLQIQRQLLGGDLIELNEHTLRHIDTVLLDIHVYDDVEDLILCSVCAYWMPKGYCNKYSQLPSYYSNIEDLQLHDTSWFHYVCKDCVTTCELCENDALRHQPHSYCRQCQSDIHLNTRRHQIIGSEVEKLHDTTTLIY